jgi:hypothetical protein
MNSPIIPIVRAKMKLSLALDNHWRDRIKTMKDEIGDISTEETTPTGESLIATYGNKKTADSMLKAYSAAEPVLISKVTDAVDKAQKKLDAYNVAQEHSCVHNFWAKKNPDLVVMIDATLPAIHKRRLVYWGEDRLVTQHKRLADAKAHADLYIQTDELDAEAVRQKVIEFIENY